MAHTIHVEVVSLTESVFSGDAEFVVLPGVMGELGIYPKHAPLITQIKPGEVRIKLPGRDEEHLNRESIEASLRAAAGNISRAAQSLGLSRQALYRRMERFGLRAPSGG